MGGAVRRDGGSPDRKPHRGVPAALPLLAGILAAASAAHADTLDGRVALELEYLGQSYFSEQQFTAEELGLPSGSGLILADTTRFGEDTWLPGQELDLVWQSDPMSRRRFSAASRTAVNRERTSQDLDLRAEIPAGARGRWLLLARGTFREDERSLVGHGDWQARAEASREIGIGTQTLAGMRVGLEHSRTRGDTTSYLYDYDTVRGRIFMSRGSGWLPDLEAGLEGTVKTVPGGEPGGYREARVNGAWRDPGRGRSLAVEGRIRDMDRDGTVGRDYVSTELEGRDRLWSRDAVSVHLESDITFTDYAGEDDLYYDALETDVRLLFRREGAVWTVFAGPAAEFGVDLGSDDRDYRQWTGRGSASRLFGLGGFVDASVEAGYRDYGSSTSQVIEVSSLSTQLLRSDYWLVQGLVLVTVPLGAGLTLDAVVNSSWEFHTAESERISVSFATLGVGRTF